MARILLVRAPEDATDQIEPIVLAKEDWSEDTWDRLERQADHNKGRCGRYFITACVHPKTWSGCGRRASIITKIQPNEDKDSVVSWRCLHCGVDFNRSMAAKERQQR